MKKDRYTGTTWHDRFLARLTTREIGAISKMDSLLILPVAAVEQHGDHAPVFTDSYLNERLLEGSLELLPTDANIWILPPLYYGKSNEHTGFSGTYSLSTATMHAVLMDLMRSVKGEGWTKLLILNSHGGNTDIITITARDARIELDLTVFCVNMSAFYFSEALPARENEYGIHAGALETSLLLSLKPEWIDQDRYLAEYPERAESSCFQLHGSVAFNWRTSDICTTGVIGDPALATPQIGEDLYKKVTTSMSEIFISALKMR
jgi:creatinine amidohydrolase